MRAFSSFIIRLVGYAFVLGIASRIAEWLWLRNGLDGALDLQPLHDGGITVLVVAPLVLALIGIGALGRAAIFAAGLLAGAALTAPLVFARLGSG